MWFEYVTERIGRPTVFGAIASGEAVAPMHLIGSVQYRR